MAILKSIITEGAKGSMGNVTLRQVCGQTVASQKRIGRAYSKLSTQQKEQCSAFKWAVKCLQYAPLYPQIAFARLDNKSGYNRCLGQLVDAVNLQGLPQAIGFQQLVDLLDNQSCQVSLGLPTRGQVTFTEVTNGTIRVLYKGFQEGDICHLWWIKPGDMRARYSKTNFNYDDDEGIIEEVRLTDAIAVVTHEGIPYTFDSSALYL